MNDECEHEQDTKMNMDIVLANFPMHLLLHVHGNGHKPEHEYGHVQSTLLEQVHFHLRLHSHVHYKHEH